MRQVWEEREVHTGFILGKPDRERPLRRLKRKRRDNIKMVLQDGRVIDRSG